MSYPLATIQSKLLEKAENDPISLEPLDTRHMPPRTLQLLDPTQFKTNFLNLYDRLITRKQTVPGQQGSFTLLAALGPVWIAS
jgi:hypothetical protein